MSSPKPKTIRAPSVKNILSSLTWLNKEEDPKSIAQHIRTIIKSKHSVYEKLQRLDDVCKTHGVEAVGDQDPHSNPAYASAFEYLNTGDTYTATIIYSRDSGTFRIGCLGDLIE